MEIEDYGEQTIVIYQDDTHEIHPAHNDFSHLSDKKILCYAWVKHSKIIRHVILERDGSKLSDIDLSPTPDEVPHTHPSNFKDLFSRVNGIAMAIILTKDRATRRQI